MIPPRRPFRLRGYDEAADPVPVLAGLTGLRHLRSMLTERNFRVLQLDSDDYTYSG